MPVAVDANPPPDAVPARAMAWPETHTGQQEGTTPAASVPVVIPWRRRLSLRLRLVLLVSAAFLLVGMGGAAVAIANAREAVVQELESSVRVTTELVEVALASASTTEPGPLLARLRNALAAIRGSRHLSLILEGDEPSPPSTVDSTNPGTPAWFAALVEPAPVEVRQPIPDGLGGAAVLIIRADPRDEIHEAWEDVRALLLILVSALIAADLLVVVTVRRGLQPVMGIRHALDAVERGDLTARLPALDLPELDGIARQFNHMVTVLEASREENRRLASRNLAIQEAERRRLAQELHDEMGQSLSAIRALAASTVNRAAENDTHTRDAASEIARISSHVYDVARGMMLRLRPVVLDELGLRAALETLIDDWNGCHEEVFCGLDLLALPDALPDEFSIGVFRIVQEALTNVAKHARATQVQVSFEQLDSGIGPGLRLSITDNGRGLKRRPVERGLGLRGIRERAEALGGRMDLMSPVEGGLRVSVDLPLPAGQDA